MKKTFTARDVARIGVLAALAMGLSFLESLLPGFGALPGVKLGLANLCALAALYLWGPREALLVTATRVLLAGFLFGNLFSLLFSLLGGLAAVGAMILFKQNGSFSPIGVSCAGGVAHNVAQLAVASLATATPRLGYYLPVLLLSGALTGALLGLAALPLLRVLKK